MKHQATRLTAVMLSVLLLAAVPAQANTITFTDVIVRATVDGDGRGHNVDLHLRSLSQQHENQIKTPSQRETTAANSRPALPDSTPGGTGASVTGTVLSPAQDGNVEVVEVGDITGTICDCGEIPLIPIGGVGGGFPIFAFPLLALAAIPLFFLGGDSDINNPFQSPLPPLPTPTVLLTPPPAPIPEPTTMLLLGSGLLALGAGSRRRRRRALAVQVGVRAEVREV